MPAGQGFNLSVAQRNTIVLLLFSFAWLMVMTYSHEYFSQKVSQSNQQQLEQTQQLAWHLDWPLASRSEIVSSFKADWQLLDGGLKSSVQNPELSLKMQGRVIEPGVHQALYIDAKLDKSMQSAGAFRLEFSSLQQNIFFLSDELPVLNLASDLDLSVLSWYVIQPDLSPSIQRTINWTDLPVLDALVIRFYFPQATDLELRSIQIKQTQTKLWSKQSQVDCQSVSQPSQTCFITNHMRTQYKQQQQSGSEPLVNPLRISALPPLTWLLLAAGSSVLATLLSGLEKSARLTSMLVIMSLYSTVWLLHQHWLATYFNYLWWPVLGLMLVLLWQHRRYVKGPLLTAKPVWLLSMVFSVVLLVVTGHLMAADFWLEIPQYLLWAWVQQLLLGPLVSGFLFKHINASRWLVAAVVGVLFSSIHAPNHVLMVATLVGGFAWSYAWLKYENLYANAFSHALLALVFYQVMPEAWLGSARIGVFF